MKYIKQEKQKETDFKIDLIVWKYKNIMKKGQKAKNFKIDLIVCKYISEVVSINQKNTLKQT